jgi:hypothetical protein
MLRLVPSISLQTSAEECGVCGGPQRFGVMLQSAAPETRKLCEPAGSRVSPLRVDQARRGAYRESPVDTCPLLGKDSLCSNPPLGLTSKRMRASHRKQLRALAR